jgi:hypothetical protein
MGGAGDDEYNVALTKSTKLEIFDAAGDNTLNLKASQDSFRLFFNVELDDFGEADEYDLGDQLVIFNKDNATVNNLLALAGGKHAAGSVLIYEGLAGDDTGADLAYNVNLVNNAGAGQDVTAGLEGYIDNIAHDVATWLVANNYGSTEAVIAEGDKTDMASLMQIYTNNIV